VCLAIRSWLLRLYFYKERCLLGSLYGNQAAGYFGVDGDTIQVIALDTQSTHDSYRDDASLESLFHNFTEASNTDIRCLPRHRVNRADLSRPLSPVTFIH
jgi:hypothetical protein